MNIFKAIAEFLFAGRIPRWVLPRVFSSEKLYACCIRHSARYKGEISPSHFASLEHICNKYMVSLRDVRAASDVLVDAQTPMALVLRTPRGSIEKVVLAVEESKTKKVIFLETP